MPGMVAQGRDQGRIERLDPLEGDAAGLAREGDQAEATRGHHRELRELAIVVRLLDLAARVGIERHGAVGKTAAGRGADRAGRHACRRGPPR